MQMAYLVASRSTCLAIAVGAVIVMEKQVIATGYNGPPTGTPHCTDQGFCYPELLSCGNGSILPSRAIHAEANAIAQAAKHGSQINGATIYITLEPCLSCLKLIIAAGIQEVVYHQSFEKTQSYLFIDLIKLHQLTGSKFSGLNCFGSTTVPGT